jgi:hypothetical protein
MTYERTTNASRRAKRTIRYLWIGGTLDIRRNEWKRLKRAQRKQFDAGRAKRIAEIEAAWAALRRAA